MQHVARITAQSDADAIPSTIRTNNITFNFADNSRSRNRVRKPGPLDSGWRYNSPDHENRDQCPCKNEQKQHDGPEESLQIR